jgi:hypothetical protein
LIRLILISQLGGIKSLINLSKKPLGLDHFSITFNKNNNWAKSSAKKN